MTNKNLQQDHCSSICNALMMITGVMETFANVICIVCFGRDFHNKAIQHFRFSCTKVALKVFENSWYLGSNVT